MGNFTATWGSVQRVDVRREKRYEATASVLLACDFDKRDESEAEAAARHVREPVELACAPLSSGDLTFEVTRYRDSVSWRTSGTERIVSVSVCVVARLRGSKPSQLDALVDTFRERINADEAERVLLAAAERGLEAWREHAAAELAARQACRVAEHMAKDVCKRADEACRYTQRLAALKAEYAAECAVQTRAVAAEATAEPMNWADGTPVPERVVRAAVGVLGEAVKEEQSDGFLRSYRDLVTVESLKESEAKA